MKILLKQSETDSFTYMRFPRQAVNRYHLRIMILNIRHHCFHFFSGIFVFVYIFCLSTCQFQ